MPDPFYIRTEAPVTDDRSLVLKDGETFVVLTGHGEIAAGSDGQGGPVPWRHALPLAPDDSASSGQRPLLLGGGVRSDNARSSSNLTNPDLIDGRHRLSSTRHGASVATRSCSPDGAMHHRLRIRNHGLTPVDVDDRHRRSTPTSRTFSRCGARVRAARGDALEPVVARRRGRARLPRPRRRHAADALRQSSRRRTSVTRPGCAFDVRASRRTASGPSNFSFAAERTARRRSVSLPPRGRRRGQRCSTHRRPILPRSRRRTNSSTPGSIAASPIWP